MRLILLGLLALLTSTAILAQTPTDRASRVFNIPRTTQAPQLDGNLDEAAWSQAIKFDDLRQSRPDEYAMPTESTDVYVMYDQDYLYVGMYAHDSRPDEIVAMTLQQGGSMFVDDNFTFIIDPFNQGRGGYQFQVNPNGVRSEALYTSATSSSRDWEGIWNAAAQIVSDGWVAEMAIPFKTLSFNPENTTWGVNFWRTLQRNQETMAWYSFNGGTNLSSTGKMQNLSDVTQGIGLDIVPAIGANAFKDHISGFSDSDVRPSVDIFYKVNPQINLAVTLNTDFSATEADSNTLTLNRFRQFFQEKRSFFLNDFDIFSFGLQNSSGSGIASGNNAQAFYSRSIGLSDDGRPVDILGGIKLSGRIGETEFGTLVMNQTHHNVLLRDGSEEHIQADTAMVARVVQPVLSESRVGLILTSGSPRSNVDSSLMGVDFKYRDSDFIPGKSLDATLMFQQTDTDGLPSDQGAYSAAFSLGTNEGWSGGAQYFVVEANYDPQLGFTQRKNAELFSAALNYKWLFTSHPWIRQITSGVNAERWQFLDSGELDSERLRFQVINLIANRADSFTFDINLNKEQVLGGQRTTGDLAFNIPEGIYNSTSYGLNYRSPLHWAWSIQAGVNYGDYFTGTRLDQNYTLNLDPNPHFSLSTGIGLTRYDLPEGTTQTRQLTVDATFAFNSSLALTSGMEYDNVREELRWNNRLHWNIEPGQDLWVVLNQGMQKPEDSYAFTSTYTAAAIKFRYTLRY